MSILKKVFLLAIILISSITISNASKINDSVALNGIKEAKSVFLIDFTDVKKTAFYMRIILGTHKGFTNQGVKPTMVLVFIGQTVKYLSTKQEESFEMNNEVHLDSIQDSIEEFKALGVRMEVCNVATQVFNIDNNTIPKDMDIVADGFISLIGWQTQGYKLVPIF